MIFKMMSSMKNVHPVLLLFITAVLATSCVSDDVGEDTDGPTQAGFPEVTTATVRSLDNGTEALTGGRVVSNGGSQVSARGVCWSLEPNPTIEDSTTSDGRGEGQFESNLSGLQPNTRYYLRAYATNEEGTSYGGEVDFFAGKVIRQDVFLTSQDEVNAFGNENYLTVIGNLAIGSTEGSDIVDLTPLQNLNQVRGELVIGGSAQVENGFIRLSNPLLESLDGLENLAFIGPFFLNDFDDKQLIISENASLKSIEALRGLDLFKGDLIITNNPNLESLVGLEGLTEIDRFFIVGNETLSDLNNLSNLNNIRGSIVITENENLKNLGILSNLSGTIGGFVLNKNPLISNLNFMTGITNIRGNLILKNNRSLTDITGLNSVESVGGFLEINELQLTALDNLNEIKSVGQYVRIRNNPNLETISGLNGLENLNQFIEIQDNQALATVTGFNNLQSARGTSVTSLDGITLTTPAVRISFNDNLEFVDGFENLTEAAGNFFIGGDALMDITGFENLETIGGNFAISLEPLLTNITGYRSIKTIGGNLRIQQNQQLQNLDFLSNLETVGGSISIFSNSSLSDFCGLKVLAQAGFPGEVNIRSNAFNPTFDQIANDGSCSN